MPTTLQFGQPADYENARNLREELERHLRSVAQSIPTPRTPQQEAALPPERIEAQKIQFDPMASVMPLAESRAVINAITPRNILGRMLEKWPPGTTKTGTQLMEEGPIRDMARYQRGVNTVFRTPSIGTLPKDISEERLVRELGPYEKLEGGFLTPSGVKAGKAGGGDHGAALDRLVDWKKPEGNYEDLFIEHPNWGDRYNLEDIIHDFNVIRMQEYSPMSTYGDEIGYLDMPAHVTDQQLRSIAGNVNKRAALELQIPSKVKEKFPDRDLLDRYYRDNLSNYNPITEIEKMLSDYANDLKRMYRTGVRR